MKKSSGRPECGPESKVFEDIHPHTPPSLLDTVSCLSLPIQQLLSSTSSSSPTGYFIADFVGRIPEYFRRQRHLSEVLSQQLLPEPLSEEAWRTVHTNTNALQLSLRLTGPTRKSLLTAMDTHEHARYPQSIKAEDMNTKCTHFSVPDAPSPIPRGFGHQIRLFRGF